MARIVVLSDIHISPTHGFFWDNFRRAAEHADRLAPEAVIVSGDLCINGPDSDAEIAFAHEALQGLKAPVKALAGNHDVGDEPPGQDPNQLVDVRRLERWNRSFGTDRWAFEAGGWRLIGVNAQLFGSELEEDALQRAWLEHELETAGERPKALFLHKPLFLEDPDDAKPSEACIVPAARGWLMDRIRERGIRLVVSGHLHEYRDRIVSGVRHLWAPSTAFIVPYRFGGEGRVGLMALDFSPGGVEVQVERPAGLVDHDLMAIKGNGRYKFLRDMPHCPPRLAA
jgi:3',5'-cyclic AMP phosphodiesterase CpdA